MPLAVTAPTWKHVTAVSMPGTAELRATRAHTDQDLARAPRVESTSEWRNQSLCVPAYRIHKHKNLGYVRLQGRMIYLGRAESAESKSLYRRVLAEWLASRRVLPAWRRTASDPS